MKHSYYKNQSNLYYEVIDNFLPDEVFTELIDKIFYRENFPWLLSLNVSDKQSNDGIYFANTLLLPEEFHISDEIEIVKPLLDKIGYKSLTRVRVNLYPSTPEVTRHGNHVDYDFSHNGVIFYLNTNNGKTIINDQIEVDSIANRALFFDPGVTHCSTTCSDAYYRSTIVINYF